MAENKLGPPPLGGAFFLFFKQKWNVLRIVWNGENFDKKKVDFFWAPHDDVYDDGSWVFFIFGFPKSAKQSDLKQTRSSR
jgi:hypothetical protein